MPASNLGGVWYHGSRQRLSTLRAGGSITRDRRVAKAFSHRPSLVSWGLDGDVRHDGATPGYLYYVSEALGPDDAHPHPHPVNLDNWEWLTNRDLKLELLEQTAVTAGERLTDDQIADLRRKQREKGDLSFVEWSA